MPDMTLKLGPHWLELHLGGLNTSPLINSCTDGKRCKRNVFTGSYLHDAPNTSPYRLQRNNCELLLTAYIPDALPIVTSKTPPLSQSTSYGVWQSHIITVYLHIHNTVREYTIRESALPQRRT